ncbi:MAG: SusD/RagB family nutrient-binding outer membrane lipoprotein [Gemmatimonadaceae bacterium]|nr:SusD/RagB family nutrient-binding outer membrane lipoprotein [Chitinophagaceae bacterium]
MRKIILAILVLSAGLSCTKNLTKLNDDPKNPKEAPSYAFLTNAERRLSDVLASSNTNVNIYRLIVQHWQQTQYTDESNYDLGTRAINDNIWDILYRDVLNDLKEAKKLIPEDVADVNVQKNQLAIAELLQVYAYYYLVTTYGNIPYSESLDVSKPFPKYDDAKIIMADLITRLDAATATITTNAASFGSADIIYGGNTSKWKKFANSIKLKIALTIADDDAAKAKTAVETAVTAGVFTSADDNALFQYLSAPPNTNPIWVDLIQSSRDDFVAGSTLVNELKRLSDPRLDNFFTTDQNGGYSGGEPGEGTAFAAVSHVSPTITAPTFPGTLMDVAEVEFLLAEAFERGFNVGGSARSHYDKAITASIIAWNGTVAEANIYLAQPGVSYLTAPGNWRQKIGMQKWLALNNRGWDAWIEWRKFDYPALNPASNAVSDIPVRFPYPVKEQNVNRLNYEQASTAIGSDEVSTKLFWDKF